MINIKKLKGSKVDSHLMLIVFILFNELYEIKYTQPHNLYTQKSIT